MIEIIATYNDTPNEGISRFSYGENDKKVREYLISLCQELGLKVRTDAVGNIFARLDGVYQDSSVIMTGSHIDSVKNGGRFDGIAGSVCALEAIRVMVENGYQPQSPIEIVFFAEEEGSNFDIPVMGSKLLVGKLGIDDLKTFKTAQGVSAYQVMKNAGLDPDSIDRDVIRPGQVKNMIELHIEQSVRLNKEQHTIGIVNGIAGLRWVKYTLIGCQNHAGATPMHLRQDPMNVAARIIAEVNSVAASVSDTLVMTAGKVDIKPNISNIIPAEAEFVLDIRDINDGNINEAVEKINHIAEIYASDGDVSLTIEDIANSKAIKISDKIIEEMQRQASDLELDFILMPSGAVHDSNYMAEVTDVGMIFVPSVDGRSHVKEEFTKWSDIKAGADLLLNTLVAISQ